jgi:hypothetical protein
MDIDEFEQRLHDAEVRLARLKALYEQWFQGIERIEPQIARKELERVLELLKREQPRNTALRFRCQQLSARYGTYGIYWGRIAKQIEEGTYRRDVQRARAKAQKEKERDQKAYELDVDVELDDFGGGADGDVGDFGDSDLDAILGALTTSPDAGRPSHTPAAPKTFARAREEQRVREEQREEPSTDPAPPPTPAVPARVGAPPPPPIPKPPIPGARPPVPDAGPGAVPIARMAKPAPPAPTGGVREEAGSHSRSRPPPATFARPSAGGPPTGTRPMAPPAAPRPPAAPPQGTPGPDMRALYERYVDARRRNNERVDNVKFESLQQSVEKMMPKLREKHGNKAIDFDVVLQDGKVGLKPRVR